MFWSQNDFWKFYLTKSIYSLSVSHKKRFQITHDQISRILKIIQRKNCTISSYFKVQPLESKELVRCVKCDLPSALCRNTILRKLGRFKPDISPFSLSDHSFPKVAVCQIVCEQNICVLSC